MLKVQILKLHFYMVGSLLLYDLYMYTTILTFPTHWKMATLNSPYQFFLQDIFSVIMKKLNHF